jgi:hypothetical protein
MLMSDWNPLATKPLSHEAARRKTLWTFGSWCLCGETLLNTLLHHYPSDVAVQSPGKLVYDRPSLTSQ